MSRLVAILFAACCTTLILAQSFILNGCDKNISSPAYSGNPNGENGNGDNGGGNGEPSDYGAEYFHSTVETQWSHSTSIRISDGNIIAENNTDSTLNRSETFCQLEESIDFGEAVDLAFTWSEQSNGDPEYVFLISDNQARWQEVRAAPESGSMVAKFRFFMSADVYIRFEFDLPPHTSVTLTNIRGYGM